MRVPLRTLRVLWERAKNEHSTPSEIGWSVAFGALAGCTPLIGLHMWIAMGLATLFRKNRLWAFLGSRLSTSPVLACIVFFEIEIAHRIRTGVYASMTIDSAISHGPELLRDWIGGTMIVAPIVAAAAGLIAWRIALRSAIRVARVEARRGSSGCPQ
jgi:uncharacterized protein (DUF2062 family)